MLFHVIISARAQKHKLEGPQLDNFIQEKMRSVIIGETTNYSGDQLQLDPRRKGTLSKELLLFVQDRTQQVRPMCKSHERDW
jgi:hypothetical protein